jgi:protein-L-isoaspartate(D-aspartate) O-methyltransferase
MPAPIGFQQTISPPFVVASMTAQLDPKPTDKVLEIGTGSGYQSAVLSVLVHELYTIEIIESLGKATERRLARLGYHNVKTKIGDGYDGWAEHAPFDKIIVTCSPEQVPQPLVDQLAEGGLMVIPVGTRFQQTLYLMKKEDGELVSQAVEPTLFDPMIGTADDQRTEPQDVSFSEMVNGGFEAHTLFPLRPDGWHDLRQGRLDGTTLSGHGQLCLTFTNSQPGRNAQALQGIAVDGRQVPSLEISAWVRCQNVQAGLAVNQLPHVLVNYFDEQHKSVGQAVLGPWEGSFPWTRMTARVMVPPKARTAIVAIGLLGAIGEVSLDDVELRPATDVARRLANPASAVQR